MCVGGGGGGVSGGPDLNVINVSNCCTSMQ